MDTQYISTILTYLNPAVAIAIYLICKQLDVQIKVAWPKYHKKVMVVVPYIVAIPFMWIVPVHTALISAAFAPIIHRYVK